MSKKYIDKILNPVEQIEMEKFANNRVMFEAVRKVLLAGVYFNGTLRKEENADPTQNFALSLAFLSAQKDGTTQQLHPHYTNEQLGEDLRACAEGIRMVERGFTNLVAYGSVVKNLKPKPKGHV